MIANVDETRSFLLSLLEKTRHETRELLSSA